MVLSELSSTHDHNVWLGVGIAVDVSAIRELSSIHLFKIYEKRVFLSRRTDVSAKDHAIRHLLDLPLHYNRPRANFGRKAFMGIGLLDGFEDKHQHACLLRRERRPSRSLMYHARISLRDRLILHSYGRTHGWLYVVRPRPEDALFHIALRQTALSLP